MSSSASSTLQKVVSTVSGATSQTAISTSASTTLAAKNPFDEDTIFTDWVTPGLVSGLLVALLLVFIVSIGISWLASIQTPKSLPPSKQKKTQ